MKPIREFNGTVGQPSTDLGGPDQIEKDLDKLMTMMDPAKTHVGGESGGLKAENFNAGVGTDTFIGTRTADQAIATATADTGTLTQLFSWIAKLIKGITGKADWKTAPAKSLETLASETTTLISDLNTEEAALVTHKTSSDHDGRYFTETEITALEGARDTRNGADEQALTTHQSSGDHDTRYYLKAVVDGFVTVLQSGVDAGVSSLTAHKTSTDHDARYLAKDNMAGFIPTEGAHPATKAYVDGTLAGAVLGAMPDDSITNAKLSPSTKVGDIAMLNTTSKVSVVDAINEVNQKPTTPGDGTITDAKLATDVKVGSLSALTTSVKTSIQAAINELVTSISTKLATSAYTASDVFAKVKSISLPTLTDHSNAIGLAWMMPWKNYGSGHVIFDASAGTSPTGAAVNNANSVSPWTASYPNLMGWNGSGTFGVRVDSARVADKASNITVSASAPSGGVDGDIWITY